MTPVQSNKMAAITNPAEVAALMRNITSYKGSLVTRVALQLSSLLAVRPGELRKAEWSEINWIKKEWLMRLAFADIRKLFTEDGRFFPYLMGGL